jgi:hypothetical protein
MKSELSRRKFLAAAAVSCIAPEVIRSSPNADAWANRSRSAMQVWIPYTRV